MRNVTRIANAAPFADLGKFSLTARISSGSSVCYKLADMGIMTGRHGATALLAALLTILEPALARHVSSTELGEWCTGERRWQAQAKFGRCVGYIAAIADTVSKGPRPDACIPPDVNPADLRHVVLRSLGERPVAAGTAAERLVSGVLIDAYPCPR